MNTIPNILFVIAIAVISGYLTFLTTKGGLTDNRRNGFLRKLTNRGRIVVCILFSLLGILILQEINQKNLSRKQDELLLKERSQKDSIISKRIREGIDSSNKKLFNELSNAFAKQGQNLSVILDEQTKKMDDESKVREGMNVQNLASSLRRYNELETRFRIFAIGLNKLGFVKYDKNEIGELRYHANSIVAEILQSSFVSSNEKIYKEWQKIKNNTIIFLNFCSLPNGLTTSENDHTFQITDDLKNDRLIKFERELTDSEVKLYFMIQKIKNQYHLTN